MSAELKRHEFLFGHCDLATERDPNRRELLNDIFHYTCPGMRPSGELLQKDPEENDFSRVDAMLDFCREHDIALEWHFLSGYHPEWLASVTEDREKARLQMENGRTVLKRYHDQVRFFQVINEDWLTHIGRAKVYADQTAWFTELRREFPTVELGVCDCWSYDLNGRLPNVDELKTRYPGINFISMHAHKPRQLWASPKEMYDTYDPYLDTGIKVHITEFGIILGEITGDYRSGAWDEEKLAEYFVQAMATAFSHKAVRVFNLWSNYEKFTGNLALHRGRRTQRQIPRDQEPAPKQTRHPGCRKDGRSGPVRVSRVSRFLRRFAPATFWGNGFRAGCPGQQLHGLQADLGRANRDATGHACIRNLNKPTIALCVQHQTTSRGVYEEHVWEPNKSSSALHYDRIVAVEWIG